MKPQDHSGAAVRTAILRLLVVGVPLASVPAQTALTTVRIVSGLSRPLFLTSAPADHDRLFVVGQDGDIRIIKNGSAVPVPFLTVSVDSSSNERGLLGLAFHPNYQQNGYFYVNYTGAGGATFVVRYEVSANPDVADPNSAFEIISFDQPFSSHNGGCLQFGPDGYLYISTGDGGAADDPFCNAQNRSSLLGKLLRLDVDGGSPYAIPPTNPFIGEPNVRAEIWAFGLRNPWRFSFDRSTGDLYIGDVGQNAYEEIDFQPASSAGGENYGWKVMEARSCNSTASCTNVPPCNDSRLTVPVHDYPTGGNCSVIGGYVYRGCAIPDLRGTYFFADFCSARIWSFRYDGMQKSAFTERTAELRPSGATIDQVTSWGEDGDGELYLLDRGGEVFKIIAAGPPVYQDLGFGKTGGNGLIPQLDVCGRLGAGEQARVRLRDAPVSTPIGLLFGSQANPTAIFGGTLVPIPPVASLPSSTNALGERIFTLHGGIGPGAAFAQYVMLDPLATQGIGISNAIRVDFP